MICQFCSKKGVLLSIYVHGDRIFVCPEHFREVIDDTKKAEKEQGDTKV